MRNCILYILIFVAALFQHKAGASPAYQSEKHNLQIHKKIYVSGENIWFKNTLTNSALAKQTILYADLCDENKVITSRILLRENNHWQGDLVIPDSLSTGIYLFRVYTGNATGSPDVASTLVTVINRFGHNDTNEARKGKSNYSPLYHTQVIPQTKGNALKVYASKKEFNTSDMIEFLVEKDNMPLQAGISFVAFKIPKNPKTHIPSSAPENFLEYPLNDDAKIYNRLTLSGRVVTSDDKDPVTGEMVYFSIPDSIPRIIYTRTDPNGEFHFQLEEYYGTKDAIVQTASKEKEMDITIFPNRLSPPSKIPFFIPENVENNEFAELAIKRAQLQKAYFSTTKKQTEIQKQAYPFYGEPAFKVTPGRYVDLSNFEEITLEILPLCRIRKEKGEKMLRIYDPVRTGYYDNPMILVDGVPVHNINEINELNSPKIRRIEIQPEIRCYGELLIESALSVVTNNGGFHDINLPPNAIRMNIETFYQPGDYPGNNIKSEHHFADFRDVLCWKPVLDNFSEITGVNVQSSLEKGSYIAVAQAVDASGVIHRSVFQFSVN
ncbi:MAG: hypothetical protein K9H26_00545 [Prolixibacteraceae bacterium]|nr:hypothetical protein [Prolixibacteraceae bacterium]